MKSDQKPVSIIIVTYNNWQYTKLLLESLYKYTSYPYVLYCVDNGSTDNTTEKIAKYPNVKLIRNKINLGYPKAVNQAYKQIKTDLFALLNNDIIASPGWLEKWIKIFNNNPRFWQLNTNSNCIIDSKGSFQGVNHDSWQKFKKEQQGSSPLTIFKNYYRNYEDFCQKNSDKYKENIEEIESPMGFLGGWALLMRKSLINKAGGYLYDERFKYGFYEDMDLSWRIGQSGGKIGIARGVYLHHFINTTFDILKTDKHKIAQENKWKFLDKWENYIKQKYAKEADYDLKRLKKLADESEGKRSNIEYFGLKSVLENSNGRPKRSFLVK